LRVDTIGGNLTFVDEIVGETFGARPNERAKMAKGRKLVKLGDDRESRGAPSPLSNSFRCENDGTRLGGGGRCRILRGEA